MILMSFPFLRTLFDHNCHSPIIYAFWEVPFHMWGDYSANKCVLSRIEYRIKNVEFLLRELAAHSSILAWRIPWMEEPGGLQAMGSQRVVTDWVTSTHTLHLLCSQVNEVQEYNCKHPCQQFLPLWCLTVGKQTLV